ncbi:MAG: amino acid permease [Bacteroidota bacterium]
MAGKNKFGAFSGVFTPSILTILGVIMYMRMGWVVGNAGLIGTILIILIAHIISISTGLSVSSIATDKKVGAGGIYYILSRSMGIPIGGAIGITLYVGTAFSIALYLIGFAESFNSYLDLDTSINGLRITGSIALIVLTIIALISTAVALKTQYFILAAIIASLISIFFGSSEFVPESIMMFTNESSAPLETVFAIFFPAVTGFTAGIAMSGDLKNPKKAIPIGTISAIAVGFVVYIGLAFFISYYVSSDILKEDYNILMNIALFAPAVVAGIWGATLSSALGGILGGPRILQAMSVDSVTPRLFSKGRGKENEPVNALILAFIFAEAGILIGELDVIARLVSMFYLAAYGFINLSFFLESWANPDFQPSFKVKRWIGLIGFIASFGVMFKLDMLAMFGSIIIILGIFFWLQRKQIKLESNDVWKSVWENIVAKGLKELDHKKETQSSWNPNIIVFSGESEERPHLLELSKSISGRTGMVTNFNLIKKNGDTPLPKDKQIIQDSTLDKLGIFGRKIEVNNIYEGIENIATTFGFSGIDPNTVMMGWAKDIKDPVEYLKMTLKLIQLDYNMIYLDYDGRKKFGRYNTIDLWWRETDNKNAEMMLNISRLIKQSPEWENAKIRVLFVNHNNVDNSIIKSKITNLTDDLRISAEIKIINNGVEQKSFYEIIELQSVNSDLIILGIPNIKIEKQAVFVQNTNKLFKTIGSTLLVKASKNFNELQLDFTEEKVILSKTISELKPLSTSKVEVFNDLVREFDNKLFETTEFLTEPALSTLSSFYIKFIENIKREFQKTSHNLNRRNSVDAISAELKSFLNKYSETSEDFRKNKLPTIQEVLNKRLSKLIHNRNEFIRNAPAEIKFHFPDKEHKGLFAQRDKIYWKNLISYYNDAKVVPNMERVFYDFGIKNFVAITKLAEDITNESVLFIENIAAEKKDKNKSLEDYNNTIIDILEDFKDQLIFAETQVSGKLNNFERETCIEIIEEMEKSYINKSIKRKSGKLDKKLTEKIKSDISGFSKDWYRNQTFAHEQGESEINLSIVGISVFGVNQKVKYHIHDSVISPHHDKLKLLSDVADNIHNSLIKDEFRELEIKDTDNLEEGIAHINFSNILEIEEESILDISHSAPQNIELMSADSFNVFFETQNDDVEGISIDLANIQDFIIQNSYLSPLQVSMQHLENNSIHVSNEIYNSANLLKHIAGESIDKENKEHYIDVVSDVIDRINSGLEKLHDYSEKFNFSIDANTGNTLADLNIRTIIENIDSYPKMSKKPIIHTKFHDWYIKKQKNIANSYRTLVNTIAQRKQSIDTLKFDKEHNQYLNNIELTNNFIDSLQISPVVDKELPFYYKKLFTGSHLGADNLLKRDRELSIAKNAVNRIDSGVNAAIMVVGESLSGKTYFSETVAKTLMKGERHTITPPLKQKFDINDMHQAFQKTFSKSGTTEAILNQLEQKSVLIFNDIEKWWIKSQNGNVIINYLAKMIESFGDKHYFILNTNLHSYHNIIKNSTLEKQLLTTIIMSPASRSGLKDIIMERHKIAGVDLWYNNKLITDAKKVDPIFAEIHNKSGGNIGIALNYWIKNIDKNKDDQLFIRKGEELDFPNITNPNWKIVLYQLVIHNRLTEHQIKSIYGENEYANIMNTMDEIVKSGLILKQAHNTYALNKRAKHYVEDWLKDLKIL